jgi:TP901 family phage tail tape measure protein
MAAPSNLVLQLLITAKDNATAAFSSLFGFLDNKASVVADKVRAAFTNLFGGGVEGAIEFEAQLDKVQAKGSYTAAVMATLKKSAEDIGAQFGISGTEAAQGMESLAAAGLNAEQVIQTLPTVLSLAKAEALSFDAASALVANSLTTVGLGFDQAARLADVLTQAANESTTSASAVGKALETAGGIARASALDLEQTVAALTALAKGGIEGERAGTALAAILTQLLNPASAASKALDALGITSRDLGTVIGELESRGAGANTAILAFLETAGPGLRALIGQGQGALTELETSMRGAAGAAGNAAEQMGGNLKTALSGLQAAWESVKTALLEPVLEPLAKAANDASTALNTNLREGALKPVQAAIKTFVEQSVQFAREFITSFDFKDVAASLQSLASNAASSFTAISDYGGKAANTVQIAWNGVTGTVKAISAAMLEVAAGIATALANIEEAASKVGLGSVERATALQEKANALKDTARELRESARQDADELFGAYGRLNTSVDATAKAQQNLKAALPVAELQTLTKTLDDYRGIAERANQQSAQAAKAFEAGKISAQDYGAKILAAAEASQELANQIQATATATTFGKEALAAQLLTLLQTAEANAELADAQDAVRQSALNLIQAEIDLARAKGDTAEVTRLLKTLADTEIEQARAVAAEKEKEASSLREQLANRLAYRASLDATNAALEQEIQLLVARTNAANGDVAAAQKQVETLEAKKTKQKETTDASKENTGATKENSEATKENAQATDDAAKSSGGLAAVVGSLIDYWREQTATLSEATKALFELKAGLSKGIDISLFGNMSDEAVKATKEIEKANAMIEALDNQMAFSTGTVGYFMDKVQKAGNEATKAYYEQKLAAESLEASINQVGVSAVTRFGSTAAAAKTLTQDVEKAIGSFDLLNDQDLDQLRSALDSANDKLREMKEATEDARTRLAELNAELLEAQGLDQKAELLRQQIDYQQTLAEIEAQRREAELMGNRELVTILNEQQAALEKINRAKIANIRADADTRSTTDRTTSSGSTASSGGATLNVSVNAGGARILDSAFVSDLARQLQPEFERFSRRLA